VTRFAEGGGGGGLEAGKFNAHYRARCRGERGARDAFGGVTSGTAEKKAHNKEDVMIFDERVTRSGDGFYRFLWGRGAAGPVLLNQDASLPLSRCDKKGDRRKIANKNLAELPLPHFRSGFLFFITRSL